jgi:hypothetical protein
MSDCFSVATGDCGAGADEPAAPIQTQQNPRISWTRIEVAGSGATTRLMTRMLLTPAETP